MCERFSKSAYYMHKTIRRDLPVRKEWIDLNAAFLSSASVVGAKESEGPLGELFDLRDPSDRFGMKSWERAESEMQRLSFNTVLAKANRAEGKLMRFLQEICSINVLALRTAYLISTSRISVCTEHAPRVPKDFCWRRRWSPHK